MESRRQLRDQLESLRGDRDRYRSKLRECAQAYRNVTTENGELRREVEALRQSVRDQEHQLSVVLSANERTTDKYLALVEAMSKDISRGPEVISEAILTGLGNIMNGYAQAAAEQRDEAVQQMSMGTLGLDNDAGVPHGTFFPDVEFDEWTGPMPTPGMMTSSPVSPGDQYSPVHGVTENGQVARMDGQPMFQAGTSGPPPAGGIET